MPAPPLAVILTGPATPCRVGEPVAISVEVRNVSDRPLRMAGVLDGSEAGFRFPKYRPVINGPNAGEEPGSVFWCGTVAQIHPQDMRLLMPGEGFDPRMTSNGAAFLPLAAFLNFRPATPGSYRVSLTIDTTGVEEEWLGRLNVPRDDEIKRLLKEVPRGEYVSNTLDIEVLP
ncbi:hypothetical protein [Geobacter grbiciae]|uniref:hypothetical protein n=1 Tax=Geobacter grbiciae TaxID=155042 RepID=UPI001C02E478|nr:hypothetical protein [Geobacter grbiciae]MBT1076898.1 hypothetical protein [Geobacter grbiciae]